MPELDKVRIFGMLREVKALAMQASLTHSMRGSTPILADMYNQCLKTLAAENNDPLLPTLFKELARDTVSIDEVGASAALLSRYIRPEGRCTGFETGHEDDED